MLNTIDIFCVTSILNSESFGVAVVEAMACEVPVIATDVDGFKEVVNDNITGYKVKRKNIEEIAQKIEKLVIDKEQRTKMGKAGRRKVLKEYDWKENVKTMENIYEEILKN